MTSIQTARVVTTSTGLPPTADCPLSYAHLLLRNGMLHARKGDTRYKERLELINIE